MALGTRFTDKIFKQAKYFLILFFSNHSNCLLSSAYFIAIETMILNESYVKNITIVEFGDSQISERGHRAVRRRPSAHLECVFKPWDLFKLTGLFQCFWYFLFDWKVNCHRHFSTLLDVKNFLDYSWNKTQQARRLMLPVRAGLKPQNVTIY